MQVDISELSKGRTWGVVWKLNILKRALGNYLGVYKWPCILPLVPNFHQESPKVGATCFVCPQFQLRSALFPYRVDLGAKYSRVIKLDNVDTWSKRILLPEMGSDARHHARPTSLAMVKKGRGSRSRRGSTSRKRDTTTQYLVI